MLRGPRGSIVCPACFGKHVDWLWDFRCLPQWVQPHFHLLGNHQFYWWGNFRYLEAEVFSPSRTQTAHDFSSPELPPLYQATMFATTGALPLPGGMPLEHGVGRCLPHRPRGFTALFVLDSRVIPSNPAGCSVRKRRPALRERSPWATGLPAGAPCLFSFLDTLVT